MQIVCCCDATVCEMVRLQNRVNVLTTLCGLDRVPHVVAAAMHIQRRARRTERFRRARRCAIIAQRALVSWRVAVEGMRRRRKYCAASTVQAAWRGRAVRATPAVRLLCKYLALQHCPKRLPIFAAISMSVGTSDDTASNGDSSEDECSSTGDDDMMDVEW